MVDSYLLQLNRQDHIWALSLPLSPDRPPILPANHGIHVKG